MCSGGRTKRRRQWWFCCDFLSDPKHGSRDAEISPFNDIIQDQLFIRNALYGACLVNCGPTRCVSLTCISVDFLCLLRARYSNPVGSKLTEIRLVRECKINARQYGDHKCGGLIGNWR